MNALEPKEGKATTRVWHVPVEGMSCASCATRLQRVLERQPGVEQASINFASEQANITTTTSEFDGSLVDVIVDAGFDVPTTSTTLNIEGMSCASCVQRIEKALKLPGVEQAEVNLASEQATIRYREGVVERDDLIEAIVAAGYRVSSEVSDENVNTIDQERRKRETRERALLLASVLLTVPLVAPMGLMLFGSSWALPGWLQLVLATPVQFLMGARFYRGAAAALKARTGNMDLLVALGTTAAYGLSVYMLAGGHEHLYFEASASVITLVLVGKYLEARAKRQTTDAVRALMALRPETARVQRDGTIIEIASHAVVLGDLVIVRPGERLPVDGTIVRGESALDESLLTGESLPVMRGPEDSVIAGSINGRGVLHIKATGIGQDSFLAKIIAMIESAQASRAPIQGTVNRIAAVFVPAVVALSLVTLLGWGLAGASLEEAVLVSVAVLVIACPCALGLATPAALMVGTGMAARAGILIKDAEALERTHQVDTIVFDKTGTLTRGTPEVEVIMLTGERGDTPQEQSRLLAQVAAVQEGSEHPLADAIMRRAHAQKLQWKQAHGTKAHPGLGIEAVVDGQRFYVGSRRWMEQLGIDIQALEQDVIAQETRGATVMWIASAAAEASPTLQGAIAVRDQAREGIAHMVSTLKAQGIGVVMLTGDNTRTAQAVADGLGIERVVAEVLPEDKANIVASLQRDGGVIAMVGDGVNDAPALAQADVSFAMSSGTDVAMHTASVTLMRPNPPLLLDALTVSKATTRKIHQNLFWAFIYNVLGLPLAAFGLLNPVVAGAAMAASSVSVILNALLLRRWRPQHTNSPHKEAP